MKLAAIVPCFNLGHSCVDTIQKVTQYVDKVIAIDDGSTDNTHEVLKNLDVEVVSFPTNRGKGSALIEGFKKFLVLYEFDAVITIDGDGQHNPDAIPKFVQKFTDDKNDIIIGVREFRDASMPLKRKFSNLVSSYFSTKICGQKILDSQSGYRLISRRVLEKIINEVQPGRYETESIILFLAASYGYKIVHLPIETIYRKGSKNGSHFRSFRDTFLVVTTIIKGLMGSYRRT